MRLMTDLVGRTLAGRYRLDARRSAGVSGEAYTATDTLLARSVVVKVAGASSENDSFAPWRMAAQSAARLSHPNVVRVHDWGIEDDIVFLVTEPVDGTDVRDLLVAKGSIEPLQAAEIMSCVCDALVAAHSLGLIHHDVRPENILVSTEGRVKVADFGIAPVAGEQTSLSSGMGTRIRYMSPEEAQGLPPTGSSDIWAAGAVLAEMLTGRPPQQGSGTELVMRRALEEPHPPSLIDPRIPKALDDIVMRACALDPYKRYSDGSDMAHDLRRASVRSLPDAPQVDELIDEVTGDIYLPDLEVSPKEERKSNKKQRRARRVRFGRLGLLVALIAGLLWALFLGASAFLAPDLLPVPKLAGLSLTDAQSKALDFEVTVAGHRHDHVLPQGAVVVQIPKSGKAEEGSNIRVILSSGPPLMDVPDVEGESTREAKVAVTDAGLTVGKVLHRYSASTSKGDVITQIPGGGRIAENSAVHLVISKGSRPLPEPDAVEPPPPPPVDVVLPDVRNLSVDAATAKLESANLGVKIVRTCGGGDQVVDTLPVAGSKLTEGDTVTLFVC